MKIKELSVAQAEKLQLSKYNRELRPEHVASLATGYVENFTLMPPIQITTKNIIIDGAHRREAFINAAKSGRIDPKSKLTVIVVEANPEDEKRFIMKANTNAKNYTLPDYINMNVADGIDDYKLLEDWCRNHELCVSTAHRKFRLKHAFGCAFLLGRRNDNALRSGGLKITPEDIEMGNIIYNEINELRMILGWPVATIRYDIFAQVWRDIRENHEFSEWKKEFKNQAPNIRLQIPYTIRGFNQFLDSINGAIDRKAKARTRRQAKKAANS